MAHLRDSASTELRAITINGCIHVESDEDVAKRREQRRKERKSRWGQERVVNAPDSQVQNQKVGASANAVKRSNILLGPDDVYKPEEASSSSVTTVGIQLPTLINASAMDEKKQQIYFCQMAIQEATVKLGRPDLGIPANPRDRSPSPEPVYNSKGIRINTREDRVRNKLINQRNAAITKLKAIDPTYQPPSSYKYKNVQLEDRVIIPAEEYPNINFMGLLLGPRGNFLEELKAKTKCNIIIRGKGSLKSGMTGISKDGRKYEALDEPLHAFITASTAEDVQNGVKEVQELINMQVYSPDCEKAVALRAKHMHDLAVLNGTVKDVDLKCLNCGRMGHKSWQCDESSVFTASVICSACGGVGHVTSDCRQRRPGETFNKKGKSSKPEVIDKEYEAFLSDMGMENPNKKKDSKQDDEPYVPPTLGRALMGKTPAPPLMLTNGSNAPGAASAHARAVSSGQTPGGFLQTMGKSIFGGKLTRLTSGYKSHSELEMEREKKRLEWENRPVPVEWQVERYESGVNRRQEEYLKTLEVQAAEAKRKKAAAGNGIAECLAMAPPPPPPGSRPAATSSSSSAPSMYDLPRIVGNPMSGLKR